MLQTIITVIITLIIVAPITWIVANAYRKNIIEKKIGSAEDKAREIIARSEELYEFLPQDTELWDNAYTDYLKVTKQ